MKWAAPRRVRRHAEPQHVRGFRACGSRCRGFGTGDHRVASWAVFWLGLYGSDHGYHWRPGHCQLGLWMIRDTGGILFDMSADKAIADELRHMIESGGNLLADLHIWRLGPGHYGAIVSIVTAKSRDV